MNPYIHCPSYETESFMLRIVSANDAEDLLQCYADKEAVARMNTDACTSSFYFESVAEMEAAILFWLSEYKQQRYVRFAVVDKENKEAIGTVEIFGGEFGVLRIDLCSAYETPSYFSELLSCAVHHFYTDFDVQIMCIKVLPEFAMRTDTIKKFGFILTNDFRPGGYYYARKRRSPIAYCGLACCVCEHDATCVGCQEGGCSEHGWCKNYNCCKEKKLNGCWECSDFPCDGTILDKPRIKVFAAFAKQYGVEELTACVLRNKQNGIVYHYSGELIGDYDNCGSEEKIFRMLKGE